MTLKTWSFSKKINSTAQPAGASRDYAVYMKENTSIERPVFIIGTGIDADINYCQWSGNYYFIDDIVLISADQVELHCTLDALATHKTAIGNYNAYIRRSASDYNNMIYDEMVSQSQKIFREDISATALFGANQSTTGVYVIGVIGGFGSTTGGISCYVLTPTEFEEALDFMFTDTNSGYADIITDSVVKSFFNPFQYIVFLRWYPLTKAPFGTLSSSPIKFGWWQTSNSYDKLNEITITTGEYLTIPTPGYVDFRSYDSRFTQYFVELPTVGGIYLDPSILNESGVQILIGFNCDIATGDTIIYLDKYVSSVRKSRIGIYKGQFGASIPVGQVNGEAGSLLSSAAALATGIVTKSPEKVAGGAAGVIGSYNPPPSMLGTYGSRAYFAGMVNAYVTVRSYQTGDLITNHYGRPLEENRVINTLSGYVQCVDASISLAAPDSEIETVNNFLNSGFYYE